MKDVKWGNVALIAFLLLFGAAFAAFAQDGPAIGIGPRVTFQSGDAAIPGSSALRMLGGQFKLRLTPKTAVEVSADYDSSLNESLTQSVKSFPIQASLLVFPMKTPIAPYLLGGLGWYRQSITTKGPLPPTTQSVREMGYHAGIGAELRAGKHLAFHGDYRYTHIRFGGDESADSSFIPGLSAVQNALKLAHDGSMWNWGMTYFF
jgi:opacity protein-like surface antigen